MDRRCYLATSLAGALAVPLAAGAQPAKSMDIQHRFSAGRFESCPAKALGLTIPPPCSHEPIRSSTDHRKERL
jgi:hypothetical protein